MKACAFPSFDAVAPSGSERIDGLSEQREERGTQEEVAQSQCALNPSNKKLPTSISLSKCSGDVWREIGTLVIISSSKINSV